MKLSSLIREDLVFCGHNASTKLEAIDALLDAACRTAGGACLDRETARQSILDREAKGSTTYPMGVAIPHGRIESLDDCIVAVLVPRNPILDGDVPIRMIFLILTSKTGSSLYLKTLGAIARVAKDEALFASLAAAGGPARFLELLNRAKIQVEHPPLVGDLMSAKFDGVAPSMTIRELIDRFQASGRRWAAVVGPSGEFLGEISLFEIIDKGMPNYSSYMENLAFMPAFRPFEALLEKESVLTVGQVMDKPPVLFGPGTSAVEAVFELVRHHRGSSPVVDKGKIVGVFGLADFLLGYMRG